MEVSMGWPSLVAGSNFQFFTALNASLSNRSKPLVCMIVAWVVVPKTDISNRTLTTPSSPKRFDARG